MKILKKLSAFALILAILTLSSLPAAAQASDDRQKMADALGSLGIISGTNGEYYLDNQLRRSEAAVFIVRITGMNEHVNKNKTCTAALPIPMYRQMHGMRRSSAIAAVTDSSLKIQPSSDPLTS